MTLRLPHAIQVRTEHTAWSIAVVLLVVAAGILARNLALTSPLVVGDEYAYFAAASTFPNSSARFAVDPYLPKVYSPVYAAYGRTLFLLSERPERLMKVANTIVFILTTLLFLRLAGAIAGRDASLTAAVLFVLLPSSAYTAYFMPETTYAFLFALLTWSMVTLVPRRTLVGAAASGAIAGVMLLIKPHAIALVLTGLLTVAALAIAPSDIRPGRRTALGGSVLFVFSAYASLALLNTIFSRQLAVHPFGFIGTLYGPYLDPRGASSSSIEVARRMAGILAGHLIVFGALVAPIVALAIARLHRFYAQPSNPPGADRSRDRMIFVLITFTAFATLSTIGMTTNFTGQAAAWSPGELLRLHGRYYSFVIPLYLVMFFGLGREQGGASWVRVGAVAGAVLAAALFYVLSHRTIYPFDYPEAYVFSGWHRQPGSGLTGIAAGLMGPGSAAVIAALIVYAAILWRGTRALFLYPLLLAVLFLLSSVGVTAWQRSHSARTAALGKDGRSLRQFIPAAERDLGLVVGPEWNGPLAVFLFNLDSSPRVLVRQAGSTLTDADIPAGTRWVVLIGRYTTTFRSTRWVQGAEASCVRVEPGRQE